MPEQVPVLEVRQASVVIGRRQLLKDINLKLMPGEFARFFGKNGAGKSTLVKLLTRSLHPSVIDGVSGEVILAGQSNLTQSEARKIIGVVSPDMDRDLISDPTLQQVVLSGSVGSIGVTEFYDFMEAESNRCFSLLQQFRIDHLADQHLSMVSTGEARKAWVARALMPKPQVFILDEGFANLDDPSQEEMLAQVKQLLQDGVCIIEMTNQAGEVLLPGGKHFHIDNGVVTSAEVNSSSREQPSQLPAQPSWEEYNQVIRASPVHDVAVVTPVQFAPVFSEMVANKVYVKREDLQPVRSFKLRGAYAMMARLPVEQLSNGIITASAGNHAQGVALAGQKLGVKPVIVVPMTTPQVKIDAILAREAELILHGDTYDEAFAYALKLSLDRSLTFIPPFDHPEVIAGQGTIAYEIVDQIKVPLDAIFVSVGGGGLIGGIAVAMHQLSPKTKIIGVEPEDSDAMSQSLKAKKRVTLEKVGLLADGVAVRTVGEETFRIAQQLVDEIILVSNDEICAAVKEVFEENGSILEPSGALPFAAIKKYAFREKTRNETYLAIACGANVNFDRLRYISERATVGERKEAILACRIPEIPGSFRKFCSIIGERAVTEFNYRMGDIQKAAIFVGISVKSDDERHQLVATLSKCGYETLDLTSDELATTHLRHMVGGHSNSAANERLFHFDFPERSGALMKFLNGLGDAYNISLFHYRNHGSDRGRVLVGFQVPKEKNHDFEAFRLSSGYESTEVTAHPGLSLFLKSL